MCLEDRGNFNATLVRVKDPHAVTLGTACRWQQAYPAALLWEHR
ncbi:MAG: hypothetical protein ABSF69_25120 [Polyangiaceae bacterium]